LIESLLMSGVLLVSILLHTGKIVPVTTESRFLLFVLTLFFACVSVMYFLARVDHSVLPFFSQLAEVSYGWVWIAAFLSVWLGKCCCKIWLKVASGAVGVLLLILLAGILVHAAGYLPYRWGLSYTFAGYSRPHGLLMSPLEAGIVALITWAWGMFWMAQPDTRRWVGTLLVGLSSAAVYLTLSRSAWLGLGAAVGVGILFALHRRLLWLPLGVTVGVFVLCSLALPVGWSRSVYAAQGDPSVASRLTAWRKVPTTFAQYPFGVSEEAQSVAIKRQEVAQPGSALNFYIEIGLAYGVLPFLLTGILVFLLLLRAWQLGSSNLPEFAWGLGTIATVVALFFTYPSVLVSIPLGGLWGMVSAMEVKPDATTRVHAD
jgi:O-antigen ligase